MTQKLLRFAYVCEFLLALVAVFATWSEIGGQSALDLMHWGWKVGFGAALSGAIVGYTAAIVSEDKIWTVRSARWMAALAVLLIAMSVVTYYYTLQEETGDSEESGNVSRFCAQRVMGRLS